tara:strand:- start:1252 stop:2241 length:990 start_codon:yes stop_codon:yes gene_type:complete
VVSGSQPVPGTTDEEYEAAVLALRTFLGVPIGKLTDISQFATSPFGDLGSVESISFQRVSDSDHVYESVVAWGTSFPNEYSPVDASTMQFVDSGVSSINYSSRQATRMADRYKLTDLPTTSEQIAAADSYYNGSYLITSIDASGVEIPAVESLDIASSRPQKRPIKQVEIEITEPWNKKISINPTGGAVNVGAWPDVTLFQSAYVDTRNNVEFLGCPIGTLLYKGASASSSGAHSYQLSHRFIYDEDQHFNQTVLHNQWGLSNIAVISNAGGSGLSVQVNNKVFWVVDYPLGVSGSSNDWTDFAWVNAATLQMSSNMQTPAAGSGPISR